MPLSSKLLLRLPHYTLPRTATSTTRIAVPSATSAVLFVRIIDFCEDLVLRLRSWSAPLLRRFGGRVPRMAVGSSAALSLFSPPSAVFLPSLRVLCVSAFAGRLRAHPPGSLRLAFSLRSNLRSKPKCQNVLSVALFQPDHLVAAPPRRASAVFIFAASSDS